MTAKKWPLEGDSPAARARRIALAYRSVLEEYEHLALRARHILEAIDTRLISFNDMRALGDLKPLHEALGKIMGERELLDRKFREWGETWHAEIPITYSEDDWIGATEAGPLINLTGGTLLHLRTAGRIDGKWERVNGRYKWLFRVGDVYKLASQPRGRGKWRREASGDSIPDSGSSDAE